VALELSGEGWPQYGGGPAHDNHRSRTNVVRHPKVLWTHPGRYPGQPTIANGHLYVGGERLVRLDPSDGRVTGSFAPSDDPQVRVFAAPVLTPTRVIARVTDGRVVALDRGLERVLWTWQGRPFHDHRWGGVLVDGGPYVLGDGSAVVALDPDDGRERWRTPLRAGEEVWMTPAAHGGRVFLGTEGGRFLALDAASGAIVWAHEGDSKYSVTAPVVAHGRVVCGDRGIQGHRSGAVHAFDPVTGAVLWSTVFGATGFSTPGVVEEAGQPPRIVAGFGRSVALFDLASGQRLAVPEIQTGQNAFGSPTQVGDTLCFGNLDGRFYVHDLATGALRWSFAPPAPGDSKQRTQVGDFTYAHGRFYVSTSQGLFALGQDPERSEAPAGFVLTATSGA
jgi:outer membrane protein assembly factor BamB